MRDYKFGTYLYNLRKEQGLSQTELGKMLNVSNKAVSKWETGEAKPALKQLYGLSKIFKMPIEDILGEEGKKEKQVYKIVITGGPCGGKSTAMNWIQKEYTKKGFAVLFLPESATEVILAGVSFTTMETNFDFQLAIVKNQLAKEKIFEEAAQSLKNSDKVLIVCDRGALDAKAYSTPTEYTRILRILGIKEIELRDSYDAVFHLVTAAKGAEEYYTLANNAARKETPEQAILADEKTLSAWTGHPHLRVIDNSTNFEFKMKRLMKEISAFLGEPEPNEIERKFLVHYPSLNDLSSLTYEKVEIIQTYLKNSSGDEMRIRQRGADGDFIYTKTIKRAISAIKRVESEQRISKDEYLSLLLNADTDRKQIRKTRYCMIYKNQYLELDIYPFWKDKAILEVELSDENKEIEIPDFIKVIKEVTEDEEYKNYNIAKR